MTRCVINILIFTLLHGLTISCVPNCTCYFRLEKNSGFSPYTSFSCFNDAKHAVSLQAILATEIVTRTSKLRISGVNISSASSIVFRLLAPWLRVDETVELQLPYVNMRMFETGAALTLGNVTVRKLELGDNKLTVIHRGMFRNLEKLWLCDISDNEITTVHQDAFIDLPDLTYLRLGGNRIVNLPLNTFQMNSRLHTVSIGLGGMPVLTRSWFRRFRKIATVIIDPGFIDKLDDDCLHDATHLKRLHLTKNNFTTIPVETFENTPRLSILEIEHSSIETLEGDVFHGLPDLFSIYLTYSQLTSIPGAIFHQNLRLVSVKLNNNKITSLAMELFEKSPELSTLYLNSNELSYLPAGFLRNNPKLQTLKLQDNLLSVFPSSIFHVNAPLNWFDISHNKIRQLPKLPCGPITQSYFSPTVKAEDNFLTAVEIDTFCYLLSPSVSTSSYSFYLGNNQIRSITFPPNCNGRVSSASLTTYISLRNNKIGSNYSFVDSLLASNCRSAFAGDVSWNVRVSLDYNCYCQKQNMTIGKSQVLLTTNANAKYCKSSSYCRAPVSSTEPGPATPRTTASHSDVTSYMPTLRQTTSQASLMSRITTNQENALITSTKSGSGNRSTVSGTDTADKKQSDTLTFYQSLITPIAVVSALVILGIFLLIFFLHPRSPARACCKKSNSKESRRRSSTDTSQQPATDTQHGTNLQMTELSTGTRGGVGRIVPTRDELRHQMEALQSNQAYGEIEHPPDILSSTDEEHQYEKLRRGSRASVVTNYISVSSELSYDVVD